jgi:hypothetical protein
MTRSDYKKFFDAIKDGIQIIGFICVGLALFIGCIMIVSAIILKIIKPFIMWL